jgi:3-deoxy-D-manno-octulosonic-acid transferase
MIADLIYGPALLLWWLSRPFARALAWGRGRPAKLRVPLRQRWGGFPAPPGRGDSIWIHAVSFGEVLAARGFVRALEARWPDRPLVITSTTLTGLAAAREHFAAHTVSPSPLDLSFSVRRAFRSFRPQAIVLFELDFWPNQMVRARREGVPVLVANGKLSARSARGYRRLRRLWRTPFDALTRLALQTEVARERWEEVGVDPARLRVIGNTKVDNLPTPPDAAECRARRRELGWGDEPNWIAGSTHEGEEAQVLTAHRVLRERFPGLRLLLAPRHLERLERVEKMVAAEGWSCRRKSRGAGPEEVLLLDTMGELGRLYAAGDLVFLGGSLVPVGGHNVAEPAAMGRAQIVGPHVDTVAAEVATLEERGALRRVQDANSLAAVAADWLDDESARRRAQEAAHQRIAEIRGATAKTIEILAEMVEDRGKSSDGSSQTKGA